MKTVSPVLINHRMCVLIPFNYEIESEGIHLPCRCCASCGIPNNYAKVLKCPDNLCAVLAFVLLLEQVQKMISIRFM